MKKILLIIVLFLTTLSLSAQRRVIKLDDNLYEMTIKERGVWQTGTFKRVDNKWLRHGTWLMKIDGKFNSMGVYENDKLVRLTINTNEGRKTFRKHDFEIILLKQQIYKLEKMLSLRD